MAELHTREPERPLRIGLLTHSVNPRGGVVHTLALGEALSHLGHEVTVFLPLAPGERLYRAVACEVAYIPVPVASRDLEIMAGDRIHALEQGLAPLLAHRRFDILHAQDSLSGNALASLRERGLIYGWLRTVHHLDDFVQPRLQAWQERAFREASHVFCVSNMWRDALFMRHGLSAWRVHNGIDLQRHRPQAQVNDRDLLERLDLPPRGQRSTAAPVFLSVGGVEERKNTAAIVRAFARLRSRHPQARLLIAGGASLLPHLLEHARYLEALRDTGLADGPRGDVHRLGTVDEAEMPALYRAADVLLMPSLNEGFGLVVLEALASATPVVVSRRPPFTEHLHGPGVHWCDPTDVESIASAAHDALAKPLNEAPALCQTHTWTRSALTHEVLYRSLLPSLHRPQIFFPTPELTN